MGLDRRRATLPQVRYQFMCKRIGGNNKIRAFIERAFDWYCEEMKSTEDNSRYLYTLVSTPKRAKRRRRRGSRSDDDDDESRDDEEDRQPTILK